MNSILGAVKLNTSKFKHESIAFDFKLVSRWAVIWSFRIALNIVVLHRAIIRRDSSLLLVDKSMKKTAIAFSFLPVQ